MSRVFSTTVIQMLYFHGEVQAVIPHNTNKLGQDVVISSNKLRDITGLWLAAVGISTGGSRPVRVR